MIFGAHPGLGYLVVDLELVRLGRQQLVPGISISGNVLGQNRREQHNYLECGDSSPLCDQEAHHGQLKAATSRRTPKIYFTNTPMFATVAPLVIEGTAQMYSTTPSQGARAS